MPIYTLNDKQIIEAKRTQFSWEGIKECSNLQAALRDCITAISPDTLVISEEYSGWIDSARRIDLLGIDKQANLVVIELKRTETGAHMELQSLRYAAMLSTMTFEKTVDTFQEYLDKRGIENNAEATILEFLGWDNSLEQPFPNDIRIVLASRNFSKELTTTVMWLNERDLDIRCVRLQPYKHKEDILLNIEQIIPLPEAAEYQVKLKEKAQKDAVRKLSSSPEIAEIRNRLKAEGFTKLPQLPTAKIVQEWIDEVGRGQNLQNKVDIHIGYWIIRRDNPSLSHEEVLAMPPAQEAQPVH